MQSNAHLVEARPPASGRLFMTTWLPVHLAVGAFTNGCKFDMVNRTRLVCHGHTHCERDGSKQGFGSQTKPPQTL
eukprot:6436858-Amphidinium_carterae.1